MDRIAIVGCGGSGKSWLARSLGSLLGVTPVHLDGLYYDLNWKPLDHDRFAALLRSRRAIRDYLAGVTAQASDSERPVAANEERG